MIRHIVFFTLRDRADLDRVRDGLTLLADIPHSSHWEVSPNLNADTLTEAPVDLVVYAEFPDDAALAAYKTHPLYQKAIAIVKPLRDTRIAADIEAAPG
ncbi:stress responsive protein [Roseovarius sp. HI0049]|nr:stress responsive protein [Roseovarius sp. HI0049]